MASRLHTHPLPGLSLEEVILFCGQYIIQESNNDNNEEKCDDQGVGMWLKQDWPSDSDHS